MASQTHVVFMNFDATGHINPTLSVVAGLVKRDCKVTYFVDKVMREVVEAAGAEWRPFRAPGSDRTGLLYGLDDAGTRELVPEGEDTGKLLGVCMYDAREVLPALIEDLRALAPAPAVIVHDIFVAAAQAAAHVLRCPAVGFVPHPGPGVVSGMAPASLMLEQKPWVDIPRQDIKRQYGIDLLQRGMALEFYSQQLNIVTTIDEFFVPAAHEVQKERIGASPFRCIGCVADANVKRVANAGVKSEDKQTLEAAELPLEELDRAMVAGKKLVFVSLGTVATGRELWSAPLDCYAQGNDDGCPEGERPLSEHTGKDFCQLVWRTCFEALGDSEDVEVVLAIGGCPDALEGLPPPPKNFTVRKTAPQLEVLRRCSVFLTHGGANSMHEGMAAGVPLIVVPIFGDQPTNADSVARVGAGVSFRHPLRTLSAESLRAAVASMTQPDSAHRAGAQAMKAKLEAAGGVTAACDAILDLAAESQAQAPYGGA